MAEGHQLGAILEGLDYADDAPCQGLGPGVNGGFLGKGTRRVFVGWGHAWGS